MNRHGTKRISTLLAGVALLLAFSLAACTGPLESKVPEDEDPPPGPGDEDDAALVVPEEQVRFAALPSTATLSPTAAL